MNLNLEVNRYHKQAQYYPAAAAATTKHAPTKHALKNVLFPRPISQTTPPTTHNPTSIIYILSLGI